MTHTGVLIVEDERIVARDIEECLKTLGYDVSGIVDSGEAAVESISRAKPDIVIMDVKLRGRMDGIEAAREIGSRFGVPSIFLTAHDDDELLRRAGATKSYGYLLKPFEERQLRVALDLAMHKIELERKLEESEIRKAAILETALDCIVTIDREGRVVEFNPAAESTFGYSRDRALGKGITELVIPPESRDAHLRGLKRFLDTGEGEMLGRRIEATAMRADGTRFPVELAVTKVEIGNGPMFTAFLRDITKRKQAEEALQESEGRLKLITDSVPALVSYVDKNRRYLFVNRMYEAWFGVPAEEMVGRTVRQVLGEEGYGKSKPHIDRALMGEEQKYEISFPAGGGRVRHIIVNLVPHRTPLGDVQGYFVLGQDISDYKQAVDALHVAKATAEEANASKSRFLAAMSHELRTPLNSIIGFSEVIQAATFGPLGNPKYSEYLGDILHSGELLLKLINDMLDISKIEAGRTELKERRIDLRLLVPSCERQIGPGAEKAGVEMKVDMEVSPPALLGDERRVGEILLNLLSNAVKFTPRGGKIRLTVEIGKDGWYTFAISDTGIGIAAEDIAKVLRPFGRIEADPLVRDHEGTGLGLPLAKMLAEVHGGELGIDSEPGVGTTVTVRFPPERVLDDPRS